MSEKKKTIRRLFVFVAYAYVALATLVGTGVMLYPFVLVGYNGLMAPAPMPVYLANGFIYALERGSPYIRNIVSDKEGNKVIMSDVVNIMWHERTIYGFRRGLGREPYYYICTYGDDCSKSQHMKEVDFIRVLKEKNMPEYSSHVAKTYDQLLWEQSKTDIGKHGG